MATARGGIIWLFAIEGLAQRPEIVGLSRRVARLIPTSPTPPRGNVFQAREVIKPTDPLHGAGSLSIGDLAVHPTESKGYPNLKNEVAMNQYALASLPHRQSPDVIATLAALGGITWPLNPPSEAQVSRKSQSAPSTHRSAESLPLSIPSSKSV